MAREPESPTRSVDSRRASPSGVSPSDILTVPSELSVFSLAKVVNRKMPTLIGQPLAARRALVQGNVHHPAPDSALLAQSLDGRQTGVGRVSPNSPLSSASSSLLPRTPWSDDACSVQRPSTASSAPTSFRSPVSTPASTFENGWHRPAAVRPKTAETCPSSWGNFAKPDEMGCLRRPSTAAGAPLQPMGQL